MYKKFFIGIISIVIIVNICFILFAYLLSGKNLWNDITPVSILIKHRQISESIQEPKILFIGGSSTYHGVNTELVSKKIGYPTINLGVAVGFRLDYIFYDAKKSIQNNDIVILPLEYVLYFNDDFSIDRIIQIWQDEQYFYKMSFLDRINIMYRIPFIFEGKALEAYFIGYDENLIIGNTGDKIDNIGTKEKKILLKKPFNNKIIYLDDETRKVIIDFLNYCKEKNVKVFITYPPYYYNQKYFDGYDLEQINKINQFWQEQDVTILGQYTDFIYTDKNDFYDTEYHLNIKGREKRTEKLIELLKPYINNN